MDDLVTVATYDSLPVAELAQSRLIDDGIQAVLVDGNVIATYSLLSFALGGIKLRVRQADVERAASILSTGRIGRQAALGSEPSAPIRFYCDECGTVLEFPSARRGGVESCKNCGEYVDVPGCSVTTLVAADGSAIEPAGMDAEEKLATSTNRRIPLLIEIPAVLSFVYFPHAVNSVVGFEYPSTDIMTNMTLLFVGAVQSAIPLLLFMTLCGEGWRKFGVVPFHFGFDCSMAVAIWFVTNVSLMFAYAPFALPDSELPTAEQYVSSWQAGLMCILGLAANSLAEELAMRGYLITRLEELWHSRWAAVAVSATLFASYHAYQGLWSAVAIGTIGLLYGLFFIWQRRLWPLVIAHTIYNVMLYF